MNICFFRHFRQNPPSGDIYEYCCKTYLLQPVSIRSYDIFVYFFMLSEVLYFLIVIISRWFCIIAKECIIFLISMEWLSGFFLSLSLLHHIFSIQFSSVDSCWSGCFFFEPVYILIPLLCMLSSLHGEAVLYSWQYMIYILHFKVFLGFFCCFFMLDCISCVYVRFGSAFNLLPCH